MDFKEIKNTKHYLYDSIDECNIANPDIPVRHGWRHGEQGEWVFTDDGFVCQILRKFDVKDRYDRKKKCVRTVCGSFVCSDRNKEMLGENGIADNIYTFSGTNVSKENFNRKKRTPKELLFARYYAESILNNDAHKVIDAYKKAYPDAKSDEYIKRKCNSLLKTEKINNMIDKELRIKLEEEGVTDNWLIERYKTLADLSESDNTKLRSLDSLAKISGLFDAAQKKSEQVTIWAGFSPEQLEEVKKHGKPELIAHAEKDEDE